MQVSPKWEKKSTHFLTPPGMTMLQNRQIHNVEDTDTTVLLRVP